MKGSWVTKKVFLKPFSQHVHCTLIKFLNCNHKASNFRVRDVIDYSTENSLVNNDTWLIKRLKVSVHLGPGVFVEFQQLAIDYWYQTSIPSSNCSIDLARERPNLGKPGAFLQEKLVQPLFLCDVTTLSTVTCIAMVSILSNIMLHLC